MPVYISVPGNCHRVMLGFRSGLSVPGNAEKNHPSGSSRERIADLRMGDMFPKQAIYPENILESFLSPDGHVVAPVISGNRLLDLVIRITGMPGQGLGV